MPLPDKLTTLALLQSAKKYIEVLVRWWMEWWEGGRLGGWEVIQLSNVFTVSSFYRLYSKKSVRRMKRR